MIQKPPYSVRGYNVLFMETGDNFTTVNIANGAAISHVIMDLKESTVYMVKVQMYSNVDDQGPFSRVFKVKTATGMSRDVTCHISGRILNLEPRSVVRPPPYVSTCTCIYLVKAIK